jgi:drug/metabolite transporter (DMT)-like permease
LSALALFGYAAGFSIAYVRLPAATGSLLLFSAVQATMIGYGIYSGERLVKLQVIGIVFAFAGLVGLLLPGLSTPPLLSALFMLGAGIAWGVYSLHGRGVEDPVGATAGNFLRAVPFAVLFNILLLREMTFDSIGFGFAVASGLLTSGIGYVLWYYVVPELKAIHAAIVQLSVPVIAALGGVVFLSEFLSLHLILTSIAILGGIGLVILEKEKSHTAKKSESFDLE